ncbi:MAG: hypothetical protein R2811_14435 [Flavobacteriales bacterium]
MNQNQFEVEGHWYEAMIGSCDLANGVGLCVMITDASSGDEILDICQVDSTRECHVETYVKDVPSGLMEKAMAMFDERVRLK